MGTSPEVVDDHARQDHKADQADDPQGGEHIAEVMPLGPHAGDAAYQPGQEGDDRYDQAKDKARPGEDIFPEAAEDVAFQIQQAAAAKSDGNQGHDQGKGDKSGDHEEKGFEND